MGSATHILTAHHGSPPVVGWIINPISKSCTALWMRYQTCILSSQTQTLIYAITLFHKSNLACATIRHPILGISVKHHDVIRYPVFVWKQSVPSVFTLHAARAEWVVYWKASSGQKSSLTKEKKGRAKEKIGQQMRRTQAEPWIGLLKLSPQKALHLPACFHITRRHNYSFFTRNDTGNTFTFSWRGVF